MTQQLQQVFERVSGLSPEIQNELAASWMAELEDELIWQKQLSESQDGMSYEIFSRSTIPQMF